MVERILCQLAVFGIGAGITANSDDLHNQSLGVGGMCATLLVMVIEMLIRKARGC